MHLVQTRQRHNHSAKKFSRWVCDKTMDEYVKKYIYIMLTVKYGGLSVMLWASFGRKIASHFKLQFGKFFAKKKKNLS